MPRTINATVPHSLGKEAARLRIAGGFANLQDKLTGGLGGMLGMLAKPSIQERWEGDRLHFDGSAMGQHVSGRLDVLDDCIKIEVDLPEMLANFADKISGNLQREAQKLLEKK